METNFESTYGQKQNTFRKTQALLPTKTNKQEDKSRETYSKKQQQPWPALILHSTHNIWREKNTTEKAKDNSLPLERTLWDFHHKNEVQVEV